MKRIAIFASGAGSNAEKIIQHFKNHQLIQVALVACNKPGAGVIEIAKQNNISVLMLDKELFFNSDEYILLLQKEKIDFLILAGFLLKIPARMIAAYPEKILNIHPSLLPKFGGKGMYGQRVHEAVLQSADTHSGITIHLVDEIYDNGKTVFSVTCPVLPGDTHETLARRIHALEHTYYPRVIEDYIVNFTTG